MSEPPYRPWQMIQPWLRWYFKSHRRHGIHSPFAYQLSDTVLSRPISEALKKSLLVYTKRLLQTPELKVDHPVNGTLSLEKTKNIIQGSGIRTKGIQLLQNLCTHFQPETVLELGTNLGIGTACLALSCPPATRIFTIEGSHSLAALATKTLVEHELYQVKVYPGLFSKVLPTLLSELPPLDLIVIDGHHQGPATLTYLEWLLPLTHAQSIIVIDDIRYNQGMENAWKAICQHPEITLTLDTYHYGIAFKNPDLSQETLLLRY